ncbi:cuticle protein 14 isoform a [Caerostris darwini]|uniref:Cuticle protein 14 isoform a n=1 Tax=Caerostris darwini TaxID=1538125 RepID=A0AAV4U195_9ARAC|nr:cuticle protein 14 isoform a [Caerostris darwini]
MKVLVLFSVLAIGYSTPITPVAVSAGDSTQYKSEDNFGNYNFGYNEAHLSGGTFRKESGDALGNKIGSYGLQEADGRTRIVNYIADANGFRVDIKTNEPGIESKDSASTSVNKAVYAATDLAPESPITYDVTKSPDLVPESPITYDVTKSPDLVPEPPITYDATTSPDLVSKSPITYDVTTSPDLDSKSPIAYDIATSPAKMSISAPGVYSYANVPSTYNTYATTSAFLPPSYQYVPANTNAAAVTPISYLINPSLHKTVPEQVLTYVNAPASVPYRNYEPILVYASSAYL